MELPDCELDIVTGGSCPNTDVYTAVQCTGNPPPQGGCWQYDGTHPDC